MINITDKHNCCGCAACVQICSKHCISFDEDEQGFRYPLVNKDLCIDCGLCEKVCPVLNQGDQKKPLAVYAAINPEDDIRSKSSSGGIFSLLAESVLNEGGVIFGARFDENWDVKHDYTETKEGLETFRGSKYVQSRMGESYVQVREFLKSGRKVLFSGTSCQVAGLRKFLRKEYDNLLLVDVVCHGVPSPMVWREYLKTFNKDNIGSISIKDKSTGWREYSFTIKDKVGRVIHTERANQNKFLMAFSQNLTLRPSCFNCPAKAGKSGSDITLADYWGIEHINKSMDDNQGTSFVCANTAKGKSCLEKLDYRKAETDYDSSVPYNSCIIKSTLEPVNRQEFWKSYNNAGVKALLELRPIKVSFLKRIINRIFR